MEESCTTRPAMTNVRLTISSRFQSVSGTPRRCKVVWAGRAITRVAALFLALAAVVILSADMQAQEAQRPTFRSRVAVVPISAVVRDSRNRIVKDLRREDFEVREEGQPRRVLEFSANADGPVSVAVLLDTSGSMGIASNLARGKDVAARLLERMHPERDEMALFTFHKVLQEQVPFTSDPARLRGALDEVKAWGTTSLYDAIGETARRLSQRAAARRAVVVVSDGLDTSSRLTPHEAAVLASAIDVPVYVVAVVSPVDHPSHQLSLVPATAGGGLRDLAEYTGGEAFHVSADDSSPTADALLSALRHQYFLAIESSSAPGFYNLQVLTSRKGLQVRARRAYSTELAVTESQP
jgi:Ca-activated chloride channel family protein